MKLTSTHISRQLPIHIQTSNLASHFKYRALESHHRAMSRLALGEDQSPWAFILLKRFSRNSQNMTKIRVEVAKGMLRSWNVKIVMQFSSHRQIATTTNRPAFVKIPQRLHMS